MEPMTVAWIDTFVRDTPDGLRIDAGLLGVFVRGGRDYSEDEAVAFARAAAGTDAPVSYVQNRRGRSRAVFFTVEGTRSWRVRPDTTVSDVAGRE
jgi:hypothetical protein